jgi:hypothetical protein
MEDVLAVYERPYDPARPVVCVDEKSKQLHADVDGRAPQAPMPGRVARIDYEYERRGTANIFLAVEPLAGKRRVGITERRTKRDFAELLQRLADEEYAQAEAIVLVCDNLNTHGPQVLYERFAPSEARRLAARFEWHYTPEHGSWLNMAEVELSVLEQQCLRRRFPDQEVLASEAAAWELERDQAQAKINWQFRTTDARIKLRRLYPSINV